MLDASLAFGHLGGGCTDTGLQCELACSPWPYTVSFKPGALSRRSIYAVWAGSGQRVKEYL